MAAMVMASGLWMIWTAPFWQIETIEIRGTSPHTLTYLQDFLAQAQIKGKHLLGFNPLELEQQVEQNPLVKNAQFERELLPTRLVIKVQERTPAYLVLHEKRYYTYTPAASFVIDYEGVVLPLPPNTVPASELRVSIEPELVKAQFPAPQLDLLRQLETLQDQKKLNVKGVFNLSNPQNIILQLEEPALKIWLGRAEDLPIKLRLIEPTLKTAELEKAKIDYVDLRFWKHPVVKTRS